MPDIIIISYKLREHAINDYTHGELNANSNLFPLCHFLNGVFAPMKLDNKLLFRSNIRAGSWGTGYRVLK